MANDKTLYEQQESRLLGKSEAFLRLLQQRGILGDE
jgi:hypothetical protein